MTTHENTFELKLGRIGYDRAPNLPRVRVAVRRASNTGGRQKARIAPKTGVRAHFRKGSAGKARPVIATQRRVIVKARFAVHGSGRGAPLRAHVSYMVREGKGAGRGDPGLDRSVDYLQRADTPGNERFSFYDRAEKSVDGKAITASWASDNRHFRLIISPEDGGALGDLRPFIREVMAGLETRLGTKLTWVAVDHWDTDNPHTHVLIRGRRADGQDLFIPSKLIASGIREHAQEVMTRVLGPRLEADIARERTQEIARVGVTSLDRQLLASQDGQGIVAVSRPDLIARLERLEGWELAQPRAGGWRIADNLFGKLRAMEGQEAIEKAISAHRSPGELLLLLAAEPSKAIEGQLVHLGMADEFGDSFIAVIETGEGELRHAKFARADDLARLQDVGPGALVAFEPNVPAARPADHAIAAIADRTGGLYSVDHHVAETPGVSRGLVEANIRRLEAMHRMSLVTRSREGVFLVGHDHLKRALMFDERVSRRFPLLASVTSYWTLEDQVQAIGPTRLDRVLAGETVAPQGQSAFARQHALALQQRRLFLIEQGWMQANDRMLSASTLQRMAEHELRRTAGQVSDEIGKPVLTVPMNAIRGVYARRIDLAQGRMALIVGERHAVLTQWRPPLERFAGREVEGVARGQGVSWGLARGIGPGMGIS